MNWLKKRGEVYVKKELTEIYLEELDGKEEKKKNTEEDEKEDWKNEKVPSIPTVFSLRKHYFLYFNRLVTSRKPSDKNI